MYIDKDKKGMFAIMDIPESRLRLIRDVCSNSNDTELLKLAKTISYEIHKRGH